MNYQKIIDAQKTFVQEGGTEDVKFRKEILRRLKALLKENEQQMFDAIYSDFGKSTVETYMTEIMSLYIEIDYFIKNLHRLAKPERRRTNITNQIGHSEIIHEPFGSVLIIGAWNYPYHLTLLPMIDAIAAGNACILKPSELPYRTMHLMAEMLNNAFDHRIIYVVEGGVSETTELLKHRFDKVFFTGSPKVGQIVYEAAAKHMTPVTLELGGKSPVIVTRNANLKIAARRIVWGKFLNAGQTCVAPDYIYADEGIYDELLEMLKKQIITNDYADGSDRYVQIINDRNFERIRGLIAHEKVYYGGKTNPATRYMEPTILRDVTWDDDVMQEEIFGPVLPVLPYTDIEKVYDVIRSHEKPLSAYLFSDDVSEIQRFKQAISFGGGCINDVIMHITNENVPFGGIGNSGTGYYHGKYGFETFSHHKTILKKSNIFEPKIKYPPYKSSTLSWLKRIVKL